MDIHTISSFNSCQVYSTGRNYYTHSEQFFYAALPINNDQIVTLNVHFLTMKTFYRQIIAILP